MNSETVSPMRLSACTMTWRSRVIAALGALCFILPSCPPSVSAQQRDDAIPLDAATDHAIKTLYRNLIDAENRHDIEAVRPFVWTSSTAVFVAKTATPAE